MDDPRLCIVNTIDAKMLANFPSFENLPHQVSTQGQAVNEIKFYL